MSDVAIKVKGLGKRYRIGTGPAEPYGNLRESLMRALASPLRRLRGMGRDESAASEFWALKDISFEVKHGEAVGIIGRNGAGKSTMLKVLSRITEPTTGHALVHGRVGSLLEVGTGFHPELTGRENIYLNGAVMGMSRADVKRRFDEIVDFSGVEKLLDTPVKRYSSGMYMRLAFAVAAHLEPEVLVVDEVLAVGDAEFQNKCLGKMNEVTKQGRTVLFVSHSMGAIQNFCDRCILLDRGTLVTFDATNDVVELYSQLRSKVSIRQHLRRGNGKIMFDDFYVSDLTGAPRNEFFMGDALRVNFTLIFNQKANPAQVAINVHNQLDELYAHIINQDGRFTIAAHQAGERIKVTVDIPNVYFTPNQYLLSLWVGEDLTEPCDSLEKCMEINLTQGNAINRTRPYPSHAKAFLKTEWKLAV
jgi:lipopolysaccharide transport system ATP-binding protein